MNKNLNAAISSFNKTASTLQSSFESLKKKVEELNKELELKNREIERMKGLEEQADRNMRLTAMGEMAVKIAHEIRNPLGSMELFTSILQREITDDNHKNLLGHISSGIKNLNHVISNLLTFTKQPKSIFKEFDVHKFLDDLLQFSKFSLNNSNIRLEKEYSPSLPSGWGDEELLKQVFLNLILNAVQSMQKGGVLKVKTGAGKKPKDNAPFIEMKIIDTGDGITKENLKKIFNPFFTTRESGTGLGLAIVHNIIELHKGIIEVDSKVGKGTTFTILLPVKNL
jgi:signal transduction histidine kinase